MITRCYLTEGLGCFCCVCKWYIYFVADLCDTVSYQHAGLWLRDSYQWCHARGFTFVDTCIKRALPGPAKPVTILKKIPGYVFDCMTCGFGSTMPCMRHVLASGLVDLPSCETRVSIWVGGSAKLWDTWWYLDWWICQGVRHALASWLVDLPSCETRVSILFGGSGTAWDTR